MPTIAIVGAGPGLGLSIARAFGADGFQVALLARNAERLDALAAELANASINARAYAADTTDRAALTAALQQVSADLGPVDVLEYSPMPAGGVPVEVTAVTAADVIPAFENQLLGAIAATNVVLPGMRERRRGTLLYTTGASSTMPFPMMGNVGPALAALRNYALALNTALVADGVYAGHVAIDMFIEKDAGDADPNAIAAHYLELHQQRAPAEIKLGDFMAQAIARAASPS